MAAPVDNLERLLEDLTSLTASHNVTDPIDVFQNQDSSVETNEIPSNGYVQQHEARASGQIANYSPIYPLPPLDEACVLLREFFDGLNTVFPLFDEKSFMNAVSERYDIHYSGDPPWWAALNVALSLAYRMRVMRDPIHGNTDNESSRYLQNTLQVSVELLMRKTRFLAVEALLGISLILPTNPNPRLGSTLIAATVHMSCNHELHRHSTHAEETDWKNRIFWIAYLINKDHSFRLDQPPLQ